MSRQRGRRIAALLAGVLAVQLTAGCSGGNGNNAEGSASANNPPVAGNAKAAGNNAKPADTPAKQDPVALDWLAYNSFAQPDPNSEIVQEVSKKFNAKFNFWYIDGQNYDEALNVKLASGDMPDALFLHNQTDIPNFVDNGVLAPLDEAMIRQKAPTYAKMIDAYHAWDSAKYDGKLYAFPNLNVNGSYPTALVWRKDWLDKLGIAKIPESIQEVENAFKLIHDNDPDGDKKKDTYGMSDYALPAMLGAFGYPGITDFKKAAIQGGIDLPYEIKDDKIVLAAIQPEMKEALTVLANWYAQGWIDPEFITSENTSGYWADSNAFYNGRIALTGKGMYYHWNNEKNPNDPNSDFGGSYKNFKKSQPNGEAVMGKAPVGPEGKSGTMQWGVIQSPTGITVKAAKDPRKLDTILQMIEASASDYKYYQTAFRGIEGKDWVEENGIFKNKVTEPASEFQKRGIAVFNIINVPDFDKKMDSFLYSIADKHKTTGYAPVTAPVVDSFTKNANDLTKLTVQAYLKIILGEVKPDYFDKFVATFNANGGDQITKDVNAAYDKMLGR